MHRLAGPDNGPPSRTNGAFGRQAAGCGGRLSILLSGGFDPRADFCRWASAQLGLISLDDQCDSGTCHALLVFNSSTPVFQTGSVSASLT